MYEGTRCAELKYRDLKMARVTCKFSARRFEFSRPQVLIFKISGFQIQIVKTFKILKILEFQNLQDFRFKFFDFQDFQIFKIFTFSNFQVQIRIGQNVM